MSLGQAQKQVGHFATTILHLPSPVSPQTLSTSRKIAAVEHLWEELKELNTANNLADQGDALVDLIYVALRALWEMGIDAEKAFNEVHRANMEKVHGSKDSRPGSTGFDAVKPKGWIGPNWSYILSAKDDDCSTSLNAEATAQTANELIMSREELYGSFSDRARLVDQVMDVLEMHDNWVMRLTPTHRHALRMIVEKIGRIMAGGNPAYKDNWKDIAGYATLVEKDK